MRRALYAGSFDPLTNGHLDILTRAAKICDHLVVGVIQNPDKTTTFTIEERREMIVKATEKFGNVTVDSFSGLLAEYVNNNNFTMVIRGLRGNNDFDYEIQMAQMNARLYKSDVETVFLMTDPSFSFVSSSMAKQVHSLGGDVGNLVPENIIVEMDKKTKYKNSLLCGGVK